MRELPDRKKNMHEKNFPCSVQIRFPAVQGHAALQNRCTLWASLSSTVTGMMAASRPVYMF